MTIRATWYLNLNRLRTSTYKGCITMDTQESLQTLGLEKR